MHALPFAFNFKNADNDLAYVGRRLAWEGEELFGLRCEDRRQHAFILGQTGTGKSTLLRNLLIQDIHAGRGVGLIDPHGDLSIDLLDHIPPNRTDDVIYFNPHDLNYPISFNPLASVQPDDRHRVATGIVGAFKSIFPQFFGPRMEYIFTAALMALLECQNITLLGLPRMLVNDEYRDWVLRQVHDPIIAAYWRDEYAGYDSRFRREAIAPIQNKVGQLLMDPASRLALGQVKNRLDFRYLIDHRKIFVANLSKGLQGQDAVNLMGALLLTQFQQAALSRADIPESERVDFNLTVDEFHNFTTDSFASMLSENRKYRCGLVLAGQYMDQCREGVAEAVFGNVGTMISFRVSEKDAGILSRHFGGHYDPTLFSTLGNYEVVAKVLSDGRYADPFLASTLPPLSMRYGRRQHVIQRSRERYTADRRVVEDKINRWLTGAQGSQRGR